MGELEPLLKRCAAARRAMKANISMDNASLHQRVTPRHEVGQADKEREKKKIPYGAARCRTGGKIKEYREKKRIKVKN